jgi:hypothetical protein
MVRGEERNSDQAIRLLLQANIGKSEERSGELFLNPALEDGLCYLRDLVFFKRFPHLAAVVNRAIYDRFPFPEARYTPLFLGRIFADALKEKRIGLVGDEEIESGLVNVRGSIKPVRSVALKVARESSQVQAMVGTLAGAAGMRDLEEKMASPEGLLAVADFLIQEAVLGKPPRVAAEEAMELVEMIAQQVGDCDDLARCQLNVASAERLNKAARRALSLGREDVHLAEFLYNQAGFQPTRHPAGRLPDNPAGYIRQQVRALKNGELGYFRYHLYHPLEIHGIPALTQVQIGLQALMGMEQLLKPVYYSDERSLEAAKLDRWAEPTRLEAQRAVAGL